MLDRHASELGLGDDQRERVRAIAEAARETEAPLRETLRARREELYALLRADAPDTDRVMAQAERVGEAETALHKQRLRTLLEVRAILTPEQREKLTAIFERGRERMEERRAKRRRMDDTPE
jgi:Spy/CpxP family protein refolding chaperone